MKSIVSQVIALQWLATREIGAIGFEPELDFAASNVTSCSCVDCDMCRAANALHSGRLKWLELAFNDIELQEVIKAWDDLPAPFRKAILAIAASK